MNSPSNRKQKVKVCYEQQRRKIRIRRTCLRGILHGDIRSAERRTPRWQRTSGKGVPADAGSSERHRAHGKSAPADAASQVARPAAKPDTVKHAAPTHHVNQPAVGRHEHFRQEPRHHAPPHHVTRHRHHIPSHAHYWARPAVPLWRVGALRAWEWIEQEWVIVVNGVYYYGDGYYYDGYNYYYNGEYHMVPPPPIIV